MAIEFPKDLHYTREHEWIRVEGGVGTIGITEYAQDSLGDIVFVELPDEDSELQKDESFGVIESVKAVSDLYAPVSGKVIEVNDSLPDSPEVINDDPYGEAWLLKMEIADESELEDLMSPSDYQSFVEEEKG